MNRQPQRQLPRKIQLRQRRYGRPQVENSHLENNQRRKTENKESNAFEKKIRRKFMLKDN